MTYKEKLKTCPVCGKPHNIKKRKIALSKEWGLVCGNCGCKLRQEIIAIIVTYAAFPIYTFLFFYTRHSFRNLVVNPYKWILVSIFLSVIGTILGVFLPLKPYRDYWKEFWNKGLK